MEKRSDLPKIIIGRAEKVAFPTLGYSDIPARIDTGAKTSVVWATNIAIDDQNRLTFNIFDKTSSHYKKKVIKKRAYSKIVIANSTGSTQIRYRVQFLVKLRGKKIRASFSLADRSKQVYPVLIGRNVLRGKFIVDVKKGKPLSAAERDRSIKLQRLLEQ